LSFCLLDQQQTHHCTFHPSLQIVQRTDVGLGEAYMDGDYLVDDLGSFMALMVCNARNLEGQKGMLGLAQWANEKLLAAAHARRSNTREGEARAGWGGWGGVVLVGSVLAAAGAAVVYHTRQR
jgi:hypothetical protein